MTSASQQSLSQRPSPELGEIERGYKWITPTQANAISKIDHYKESEYRSIDLNELLNFYMLNFVEPLMAIPEKPKSIADIGTGYGWLSIAFALRMQAKVVAVEKDEARIAAAKKIAAVLNVAEKIEWVIGSIAQLPLEDRSFDAVYCIEVIEHTGTDTNYIKELARISNDILVITTPNRFFPVINHDTGLPFCHWLPLWLRDIYATCFRKTSRQDNNIFWSPFAILLALNEFERVSRFLQFKNYEEYWRATKLPANMPIKLITRCKENYFFIASKFGRYSIFFLPNLASTFRRRR
jgi:SAM-dependent methyltransferase